VSGIPSVFLLAPGFRPSQSDFSDERSLPADSLAPLITALRDACGLEADAAKVAQLRCSADWPPPAHSTAKLDLMYT